MARAELTEETRAQVERAGPAELLIGIAGPVNMADLRAKLEVLTRELASSEASPKIAVACPGGVEGDSGESSPLRLISYSVPVAEAAASPWVIASQSAQAILGFSRAVGARVSIVLGGDLCGLSAPVIEKLSYPVLEKQCDLVMPVYPAAKFDGLINSAILAPLNRALYGRRVRYPLAGDFSCSARMADKLADPQGDGEAVLWPATVTAVNDGLACQSFLDLHHEAQTNGLELSAVLAQLAGSAFLQMEHYAPNWQRVRGSQPMQTWGSAATPADPSGVIDATPMIDSFMLASRNLLDLWGLVLPPVSLLELKRLSRVPVAQFHMPDELWARIIYDFALAHRLRTLSRVHLLGALTPLYLAWVASYVQEAGALSFAAAEQRLEQLARAFESGKPYLVSRWRWPDRFNP